MAFRGQNREDIAKELGEASDPGALLQKVLDCPASGLTVREVFLNCPSLLSFVFPDMYPDAPKASMLPLTPTPTVRVSSVGIHDRTEDLVYAAPTPKLKVKVNEGKLVDALLDTGAEVNVMTSELAKEVGLAYARIRT